MRSRGIIRVWYHGEGWGVIDSPDTPGGCRANSGAVMVEGVRAENGLPFIGLLDNEAVDFVWNPNPASDADFSAQAHAVWPSRCDAPAEVPAGACRGSMWTSAGRRGTFMVFRQVNPAGLPPAPPRDPLPRTRGTVREWKPDEGWGVIDSTETPGGAWAHFSEIRGQKGFRVLEPGAVVDFAFEKADQDGYPYRGSEVDAIG